MICPKCGASAPENSDFCPVCGNRFSDAFSPLKASVSSSLFLALSILATVTAVFGTFPSVVFYILYAVGMWIMYTNAKSKAEPVKPTGYKILSVTLKVNYILTMVSACIIAVAGLVSAILSAVSDIVPSVIGSAIEYGADLSPEISDALNELATLADSSGAIIGIVIFIACLAAAAIIIVYNECFTKHYMKYCENLTKAANGNGNNAVLKNRSVAVRLLVNGILFAVSSTTDVVSVANKAVGSASSIRINSLPVSAVCTAAAMIIGYVMLKDSKD